ncbi:MAG TPA: gamma-glutamyltransferase [Thermoanaerobaculia bacterium]|nr:gamma-glutamyltransferase [Thermoanaerobaculia bacterium]
MPRRARALLLAAGLAAGCGVVSPQTPPSERTASPPRPAATAAPAGATAPAVGSRGMVSSAHPLATRAGLEVLAAGGNAFDAAVAIAATLNVVEPEMSGLGGYGTILVYDASEGRSWFLNPSGRIPRGVRPDAYRPPTPGYLENRIGAKSVSTPGNLHAWKAMSERWGALPWARLFAPAVRAARGGFPLGARTAEALAGAFAAMPEPARAVFGRGGRPLAAGEPLVQEDLARTFEAIAAGGPEVFYSGAVARAIDRAMREADGFLALADLEADRAEWWEPISIRYRGHEVVSASPPANTFDMLVRLGIMSRFDVAALGHNSADHLHRFAEATKHGFWVRLAHAGDPEVDPPPLARLLSEDYWEEQARGIDPARAKPFVPPGGDPEAAAGAGAASHTTHFVVADAAGNVVSATQTLGNLFGSRIMPAGTGVWLNNSLAYCTFEPAGNPMDAHPGRRKLSGDCPTFVLRDGRPWIALGTPGGHTIGQTVPQMVMNLLDFGMDVARALAAPRVSFAEPDLLLVEEGIPQAVREELARRGHRLEPRPRLGNAHALTVERGADGRPLRFTGAADPRGEGLAEGY